MKKLIVCVLVLCLILSSAYADRADDLIATLTDSDRAIVALVLAHARLTHKDGKPYTFKIRVRSEENEFAFTDVQFSFTEEEYIKLDAWANGTYISPDAATSGMTDLEKTNKWKLDNGYDFPIYGSTSADLSPISDYLSVLADNGVSIDLPELVISHNHEEYEWIYSNFKDSDFYLLYVPYNDGSQYKLSFQVPISFQKQYEALVCLMVSVLDVDLDEADELFHTLELHNVDHMSSIETEEYKLEYFTDARIGGFLALTVTKFVE